MPYGDLSTEDFLWLKLLYGRVNRVDGTHTLTRGHDKLRVGPADTESLGAALPPHSSPYSLSRGLLVLLQLEGS